MAVDNAVPTPTPVREADRNYTYQWEFKLRGVGIAITMSAPRDVTKHSPEALARQGRVLVLLGRAIARIQKAVRE